MSSPSGVELEVVTLVFFPAGQGPFDAARMDRAAESRADPPRQLRGAHRGIRHARPLQEVHHLGAQLVRTPRTGLVGDERGEAAARQGALGLAEGRPGHAERGGAPTDRMAVDPHAPHHLVLDLNQIAGVEEVGGGEERILDPLRVHVEAAMEAERVGLGVPGTGLAHV
jgi:hypothetical protein